MNFNALSSFFSANKMGSKGSLCVGLAISRAARRTGLPLDFESILTENHGQVKVLGKASIQRILADYGIERVLAEEGGRTSRGNVGLSERYVEFLNNGNYSIEDLQAIEEWWVKKIRQFFAAKPLLMKLDQSKSMRALIRDLLSAAEVTVNVCSYSPTSTVASAEIEIRSPVALIVPVAENGEERPEYVTSLVKFAKLTATVCASTVEPCSTSPKSITVGSTARDGALGSASS